MKRVFLAATNGLLCGVTVGVLMIYAWSATLPTLV